MTVTLQQFRDAWANKVDRAPAMALAHEYVEENRPTLEAICGGKSREQCVGIIDALRAAGNEDMVTAVTMWELVSFDRQHIGGAVNDARPIRGA